MTFGQNKSTARLAGFLYLLLAITGMVGLMYIPSKLIISEDAAATASNLVESALFFRVGMLAQLLCQTLFVFLALVLYRLFKEVNKSYAQLLVVMVVVAVPIAFLNVLTQFGALAIASGSDWLSAFDQNQRNALMMLFLKLHGMGISIVLIFWGLWLYPFGYLVYKSGFLPKLLGIFLIIGCFTYQIDFLTSMLFPAYSGVIAPYTSIPSSLGEFGTLLWLLIRGIRELGD